MFDNLKAHLGTSLGSVRRFLERPLTVDGEGAIKLGATNEKLSQQAREEHRQRVRAMKRDLYSLLEQHPTSRVVMRHLDLVERTLRRGGLEAIEALPIRVIAKALNEMERLVWDWSPQGLAELRSRMAVMVKTRPAAAEGRVPSTSTLPTATEPARITDMGDLAEVTEVDQSEYDETERSWAGQMPEDLIAARAEKAAA